MARRHRYRLNVYTVDWRDWRYHPRAFFWGPLITGLLIVFLLAGVDQSREVYLDIIDGQHYRQGFLGLALIVLLCGLMHCWQHGLGTKSIDRVFPEHGNLRLDRRLAKTRDHLSRFSAYLPLVGLGLGLGRLFIDATESKKSLAEITANERSSILEGLGTGSNPLSDALPAYIVSAFLIAALVVAMTWISVVRARPRMGWLPRFSLHRLIVRTCMALSLGAVVLPLWFSNYVVPVSRALGPLAMTAVVLITLVTLLMGIAHLMTMRIPRTTVSVPVTGVAAMLLFGWLSAQIYLAVTPPDRTERKASAIPPAAHEPHVIRERFNEWLKAREEGGDRERFRTAGQDYPVFVVATQGGGIYAASAASAFLAAMQDRCPNFAQHVFAVSGVSGGAVGSAVFAAKLAPYSKLTAKADCARMRKGQIPNDLTVATRDVIRHDHLSPALALIWPDIARKVVGLLLPDHDRIRNWVDRFNRSSALERSFACASDGQQDAWQPCGPARGTGGLRTPYDQHWTPSESVPALVLAATWVETGFRVAFAPFPMHAASDGTLFSFHAGQDGEGDFKAQGAPLQLDGERSLIEAAFVSARFPGIVPAWRVRENGNRRWNFVDGGYVDNSGVTTGVELFKALEEHIEQIEKKEDRDLGVSLHLVLLTDANTSPDFSAIDDGTRFSDLVAPVMALFTVRGELAGRAVTRAIDRLKATPDSLIGRCNSSSMMVVNLNQKTFQFTLGWKISTHTDSVVRLMLGDSRNCATDAAGPRDGEFDAVRVMRANSCVKKRIETLLAAKPFEPVAADIASGAPRCP